MEMHYILTASMSVSQLWRCIVIFQAIPAKQNWDEGIGVSLYYFLQLQVNLRWSPNKKFNFKNPPDLFPKNKQTKDRTRNLHFNSSLILKDSSKLFLKRNVSLESLFSLEKYMHICKFAMVLLILFITQATLWGQSRLCLLWPMPFCSELTGLQTSSLILKGKQVTHSHLWREAERWGIHHSWLSQSLCGSWI